MRTPSASQRSARTCMGNEVSLDGATQGSGAAGWGWSKRYSLGLKGNV